MAGMTVSSCAMLREPRSAVMGCAIVHWVGLSFAVRCCILVVLYLALGAELGCCYVDRTILQFFSS